MKRLAIVGGGSWGSALAIVLAPRFERVRLWVYEADLAARINAGGENDVYLPGFRIPAEATSDLGHAVAEAEIVLGVMPSHHARGLYASIAGLAPPAALYVSATKGLEGGTHLRVSQVMAEVLGPRRIGVLSGPTFAREIAGGEPAAIVIASKDSELARLVQQAFSGPNFRLYTNSDPAGVELGAALKNVIAIAAGICQGLGLGSNSQAALITRGLAEITRLAVAAGGEARTLAGLAGLGDLVLTCGGELSRNRQVGIQLGQGRKLGEILAGMRMVAEGVKTAPAAVELAAQLNVEMPISSQVNAILNGRPPREALLELLGRALKGE